MNTAFEGNFPKSLVTRTENRGAKCIWLLKPHSILTSSLHLSLMRIFIVMRV